MTKAELYKTVTEEIKAIFDENKVSKKMKEDIYNIIDTHLKPKNGGGGISHPPKEIEGIIYHWCRFHQEYEPESDMVMSKGKSKGYCKASISKWNKINSEIKKLDKEAVEYMSDGDFEKAQEYALKSKELKSKLNDPSSYDLEEDWKVFNGK